LQKDGKLKGIETIPGLLKGIKAVAGSRPYLIYMLGEINISPTADTIPISIEATIPFAVVFFQNKTIIMAGKLALAAIAKAQPTKNETFMPLKIIPRIMAMIPTLKAAIFPARTFCLSVFRTPPKRSSKS